MEESQPLRRSTRNSVALKNEELTPRKRKVSTPVKVVEPSTPSRRTRASSATPKKNLIEVLNTPKKTLPVLNEEESTTTSIRTPIKKSKEISPKTPSRRRIVKESVSTPKSTRKTVDTSEEINVAANRPLTRAKRKTMGEIQAAEVVKPSESEKVVQNKKDNSELGKVAQNKKDKPEPEKVTQSKKGKATAYNTGDKTDKKKDESCFAVVPRVVVTDIKNQLLKDTKNTENLVEENECGVFTSESPVKAEDVAINSPRKVPENCKSSSEASLKSCSEYIRSRSRKTTVDPENAISSVGNTDLSSVGNTDLSSEGNTDVSSVEQATSDSSVDTKSVSNTAGTSPQKVINSKDDIQNIVTSAQKVIDSKDVTQNIVTTSPQKVINSKVHDIPSTPLLKAPDSNDIKIPNIVITSPSPNKIPDSKDIPNIVITSPSPKKACGLKDNEKVSDISEQTATPKKNETNSSMTGTDAKDKGIDEPLKGESLTSVNPDIKISDIPDEQKLIKLKYEPSSPEKNNEKSSNEEIDENSKTIVPADINKVSPTKTDFLNKEDEVKLISPSTVEASPAGSDNQSPKQIDPIENVNEANSDEVNEKNSVQVDLQVENMDTVAEISKIENKDNEELNKTFDKVESNKQIFDSAECIVTKNACVEKLAEILEDKNHASEVNDANEAVTKDNMAPIENETSDEANESKLNNTTEEALKLDTSCLIEISVENKTEVVKEPTTDVETSVEKEETGKSEKFTVEEASSSSLSNETVSNNRISNEDKKESEMETVADTIQNISENDESSKEITDESSPIKPNNDSSPENSESVKNKSVAKNMDLEGLQVAGPACHVEDCDDSSSPLFYMRCDCETSDDSGDSGIHNEDSVIIFKMASQCKRHIAIKENLPINRPAHECTKRDVSKPEGSARKSLDFVETLSEGDRKFMASESAGSDVTPSENSDIKTSLEKSDVKISPRKSDIKISPGTSEIKTSRKSDIKISPKKSDIKLSPEKSDLKLSPGQSNVNSVGFIEIDSNFPSLIIDKKETITENVTKSLESTEDCTSKITGLDEILMSPKDFLNSDDESNLDSEKTTDTQSENKPSEESTYTKDSNLNATLSNEASTEDSSIKVDEKHSDDVNDISPKSAVDEAETNVSSSVLSESKSETIQTDPEVTLTDEEASVDHENEEIKKKNKNEDSSNSSEDNQICENKSENADDILVKTGNGNSLSSNSIDKNESEVSKTEISVEKNLNSSQTISSSEVDVEKSSEDEKLSNESGSKVEVSVKKCDSSEEDEIDIKTDHLYVKKNTKYIKNRRKNIKKQLDSETDGSESEDDSELSSGPPSNVATEGSDGPISGKDFIDFEAEEGEETSEDDSFIVSSGDSTASSSPGFAMKLRKRKRNLDPDSSDSCTYIDSVQRLFDSSLDPLNDESDQDISIKNKKQKLEKVGTVNKKNKRPKSILKNKQTVVKSEENRPKIKTESKVIKEFSKTGVFIVSSINKNVEEPKLSRNLSKRNSKIRREQKKSEIACDVSKGFSVSDAGNDAAIRGFVVSFDDSCLVAKKPKKADISSDLVIKKKKIKEGKSIKKTVKKTISESNRDNEKNTVSPFVVTLLLPITMTSQSVSSVLTDLGLSDISSIQLPKRKVAIVEFSNKESFKKILKLYGDLKINDKPIYILEGCSL